ncbi:GMC family oxidoreductase [Methylibium sp.]|uniref:GMC oxidoreductase n=1 Tax=Methylibium sp. TaxID=2067992 RepID=UPI0017AC84D1|nr:GMC family oxidoreductase [Methylibium sp.]MBA3588013.1 GMC family oxidoreductase [Methylibium sp.]
MSQKSFSLAVVGTGFASTFFLLEYLKYARKDERILVLERGRRVDPALRLQRRGIFGGPGFNDLIINRTPQKGWVQNIAFGGGSCWTGNTPRMHPNDFHTHSLYGVGTDWPLTYEDIEPYYVRVEHAMGIAGASEGPFPRSEPYRYPAHRFNAFDEVLAAKYPGQHIHFPSARSSSVETGRPVCCASGVCSVCPISSKFQIDLHMAQLYDDPRITLLLEAEVERVDIEAGQVTGVQYRRDGREQHAAADLVAVGAHAIMTPFILLRSGLSDPALGRYLNEQISRDVQIDLVGVDNYGGGQAVTGLGAMFLDGAFRRDRPACLVENWNVPWLRAEHGRWRQRALLKFVFEDLPSADNHVALAPEDGSKPAIHYPRASSYMQAGFDSLEGRVTELLSGLPVESFHILPKQGIGGSAHIQGTTRMGTDPQTSVVDADLRHHALRNLLVLGGGSFPTCPAANPTLTLSALSMRAAERLFV